MLKRLRALGEMAKELKCTQAQFCLAWCLANKDVDLAIMGASRVSQLEENLRAIDVARKWTPEIEKRVEEVMGNQPEPPMNWRTWTSMPNRRSVQIDPTMGCK